MARKCRRVIVSLALCGAGLVGAGATAIAQSQVIAWDTHGSGQLEARPPPSGLSYVEVATGGSHDLARLSDGSVVAWGYNSDGECDVPTLPSGLTYVEVAAGTRHSLARRSDGSVVAWGYNASGQCSVPAPPLGLTYIEIAAGGSHSIARLSDGSLVAWGDNSVGQCNVPALPSGVTYVEVAAGGSHSVARLSDGSVVAWGSNSLGQCNVPALPSGLTYVQVAAGFAHAVARRSDGLVAAWGSNFFATPSLGWAGQCVVPAPPSGLTYTEVAAGFAHTVARLSDGSIVTWGLNSSNMPGVLSGFTCLELAAGDFHTVALMADADCNHNGSRDDLDIQIGGSADCNGNGIPDECDLLRGAGVDCDGNGLLDSCELAANSTLDLNHDGRLDTCPLDCHPFWQADIGGMDGAVYAMIVYDDGTGPALYAGGSFLDVNGVHASGIAKWDGAAWTALGSGVTGREVRALAVYDDATGPALYVGGAFASAGGVPASNIARWDGRTWTAVGSGSACSIGALATFDDGSGPQLFMVGCGISKWNGSSLTHLPPVGVSRIWALVEYDDGSGSALYLGGNLGPGPLVSRWDGSSWARLPDPFGGEDVFSLAKHADASGVSLYAGTGSGGRISRWDGTSWTSVGELFYELGSNGPGSFATTLCSFDDGTGAALYVGGRFHTVDGIPASNLAKWDGRNWTGIAGAVASDLGGIGSTCSFDDGSGPALFISESLTLLNGPTKGRISRWGLPGGCVPPGSVFCEPGSNGVMACPCSNPPVGPGRGCDNSSHTGGAQLTTTGFARIGTDSLVFKSSGEKPGALSIVLQGGTHSAAGLVFGQGVRCVSGPFKRLYMKSAIAGSITVPAAGDASISTRSAALGSPILSGMHRYYGVYYRDPVILGGCPASSGFNTTQQVDVLWHP